MPQSREQYERRLRDLVAQAERAEMQRQPHTVRSVNRQITRLHLEGYEHMPRPEPVRVHDDFMDSWGHAASHADFLRWFTEVTPAPPPSRTAAFSTTYQGDPGRERFSMEFLHAAGREATGQAAGRMVRQMRYDPPIHVRNEEATEPAPGRQPLVVRPMRYGSFADGATIRLHSGPRPASPNTIIHDDIEPMAQDSPEHDYWTRGDRSYSSVYYAVRRVDDPSQVHYAMTDGRIHAFDVARVFARYYNTPERVLRLYEPHDKQRLAGHIHPSPDKIDTWKLISNHAYGAWSGGTRTMVHTCMLWDGNVWRMREHAGENLEKTFFPFSPHDERGPDDAHR